MKRETIKSAVVYGVVGASCYAAWRGWDRVWAVGMILLALNLLWAILRFWWKISER